MCKREWEEVTREATGRGEDFIQTGGERKRLRRRGDGNGAIWRLSRLLLPPFQPPLARRDRSTRTGGPGTRLADGQSREQWRRCEK